VRACAEGLAELLREPVEAGRLGRILLQGPADAADKEVDGEGVDPALAGRDAAGTRTAGSAVGGALLLSLELNVLLHSGAGRPAPTA
jgi:hypothetical protein